MSTPDPVLSIAGLTKTFTGQRALDDVGLTINPGEVRALLGQNGSGKSTLIKVLAGYHEPDPGAAMSVGGQEFVFGSPKSAYDLGCRFVHQDLGLLNSLSVLENLAFTGGFPTAFGTVRSKEARKQAAVDLERVGLTIDPRQPVGRLTAATKTAVAVARALKQDANSTAKLLVLDEPTASLTGDDVDMLLDIVRRVAAAGIGVLYVSHRLDEIFEIADSVTILRDGHQVPAPPIAELDHASLVALLVGEKLSELESVTGDNLSGRGDAVLDVRHFSSAVLQDINLRAQAAEIVGIAGVDGSGRERLLSAVFGGQPRDAGQVLHQGTELRPERPDLAVAAGVALLPADRRAHGGFVDLSAAENIALSDLSPFWSRLRLSRSKQRRIAREWFDRLQIRPEGGENRKLSTFSGGNQQKILLAKWLRCSPSLLLLEEPTQGVDIAAKVDLHQAIIDAAAAGAAVVVSSSDTDELVALCHRVLVLKQGRITRELAGGALTPAGLSHELLVGFAQADSA